MTEHQTLTVRLHPNDNVVTARIDLLPEHRRRRRARRLRGAHSRRAQDRDPADRAAGEPVRKYDQIIGFASADIAPGEHVHVHNVEMRDFDRDYAFGADVRPTAFVPESERASFEGFLRPSGKAGHPQLHRRALDRELLGDGLPPRRRDLSAGRARGLPQRRWHRRADPRHRLRHGRSRRGLRDPAAHALGLCPPSQLRRRAAGRARVRGQPDRFPARGLPDPARAALSHHDHAGHRRHPQDDRARAGDDSRDAAARQRGAAAADLGLRDLARPAMRRLGCLLRHDREPRARRLRRPSGAPRRHRDPVGDARDLRRRAPPDPARRPRGRSGRSWSSASGGGRSTAGSTAAR